jgi:hypothetical protein
VYHIVWQGISHSLEFHVNTFRGHLQLAALGDLDGLGWLVARLGFGLLNLLHYVEALEDLAEDNVPAIKPAANVLANRY